MNQSFHTCTPYTEWSREVTYLVTSVGSKVDGDNSDNGILSVTMVGLGDREDSCVVRGVLKCTLLV